MWRKSQEKLSPCIVWQQENEAVFSLIFKIFIQCLYTDVPIFLIKQLFMGGYDFKLSSLPFPLFPCDSSHFHTKMLGVSRCNILK